MHKTQGVRPKNRSSKSKSKNYFYLFRFEIYMYNQHQCNLKFSSTILVRFEILRKAFCSLGAGVDSDTIDYYRSLVEVLGLIL
jgi:hypothetical protein